MIAEKQEDKDVLMLAELVERVRRHQVAIGMAENTSGFVARYSKYLGSAKTYQDRLLAGNWHQLRVAKWIAQLRTMLADIEGTGSGDAFFPVLPAYRELELMFERLQGQANDRRCVVFSGVTGVGKTSGSRELCRRHPQETAYCQVRRTWQNKPAQIAAGLAKALGAAVSQDSAKTWEAVVEVGKARPLTLFVDDAHEGGVALMKLVKGLIDETYIRVVLLVYPTQWRRLINGSDDANAEAQQLYGRTMKPILDRRAKGVLVEDVQVYLREAAGLNGDAPMLAKRMVGHLRALGNLRALADVVEMARAAADGEDPDAETIWREFSRLLPGGGS